MKQPILEVRKISEDNNVYGWALFREDQKKAIVKNISKNHALHLKKICSRMSEIPETIVPIKNWYDFDEIVEVDPQGFGVDSSVLK